MSPPLLRRLTLNLDNSTWSSRSFISLTLRNDSPVSEGIIPSGIRNTRFYAFCCLLYLAKSLDLSINSPLSKRFNPIHHMSFYSHTYIHTYRRKINPLISNSDISGTILTMNQILDWLQIIYRSFMAIKFSPLVPVYSSYRLRPTEPWPRRPSTWTRC